MKKIILSTIFLLTWRYWEIEGRPPQTKPGCWYEGKRYQDAERVNTREPCLDCRCTEGSLRCRLRVCPRLANPVASGCTTGGSRTPRADACCPELVCGESGESHERNVTARRDPSKEFGPHDNGCVHEGVRYGPGSAMMGSRRCEYCYCISGKRRCLRPRCLLPLAGCIPLYAPYSCCPVAYNCTNSSDDSFPSVVSGSSRPKYGCRVGGDRTYEEGEMVREPGWKGRCENCFCAMGAVRCVPLSCAPPLQGCTPIMPRGQCCPSTYNCSGTIEVKANQNYASYAFISKDYAKFKKETNFFSMRTVHEESMDNSEARGHNSPDLDGGMKKEDPTNLGSTLADAVTGRTTEMLNRTSSVHLDDEGSLIVGEAEAVAAVAAAATASPREENEIPTEAATIEAFSSYQETTTAMTTTTTTTMTRTTMDERTETAIGTSNLETTLRSELSTSAELVDDGNGFATRDNVPSSKITSSLRPSPVSVTKDPTSLDRTIHQEQEKTVALVAFAAESNKGTEEKEEEEEKSWTRTSTAIAEITTLQRQSFGGTAESSSVISVKGPAAASAAADNDDDDDDDDDSPSNVLMPNNMYVINVTLRTNVSVGHIQQAGVTINPIRSVQADIAALLDITNRKKGEEDYEYEYAEPTLPPSLPNLRIIPFVAADALVKQEKDVSLSHVTKYPLGSGVGRPPQELGPTLASSSGAPDNFYDAVTQNNRFSPPVETEGGFVPREPSYFDPPYRSTDQNLQVRTSVTVVPADMTNSHRQNDELTGICVFENRNYRHGDILPSSGHCIICICYYGEVACSDEKCPPLKIGCRRLNNDKICCGKIICVDAKESPTVVLDRADAIASPPRAPLPSLDGIASPDPFRDVIKTKPAPDLPSLIEDMKPYLVEHRITKPVTETTTTATTATPSSKLPVVTDIRPDRRIVDPNQNGSKRVENGTCSGGKTSESVTGDKNQGNTSQGIGWKVASASSSEGLREPSGPDESSILSLGGVLDLIFSTEAKGAEVSAAKTETTTTTTTTRTRTVRKPPHSPTSQLPLPLPGSAQSDLSLYRADPVGGRNETTIDSGPQSTVSPDAWDGFKGSSSSFSPSSQSSIATGSSSLGSSVTAVSISSIKVEEPSSLERAGVPDSSVTATTADDEIVTLVSGLLKLAGCNIYGKMYRVGRIITELSSPCLECRCTELGVQCKQLEC